MHDDGSLKKDNTPMAHQYFLTVIGMGNVAQQIVSQLSVHEPIQSKHWTCFAPNRLELDLDLALMDANLYQILDTGTDSDTGFDTETDADLNTDLNTDFDVDDVPHLKAVSKAYLKRRVMLYTVPPSTASVTDIRLNGLLHFLDQHPQLIPEIMVYISTTGVYGNAAGAWVDETTQPQPITDRAKRRLDAEQQLIQFATQHHCHLNIIRSPGIYAQHRLPLARIIAQQPTLIPQDDVYSNHIHEQDLSEICIQALQHSAGIQIFNACDDLPLKMGDWYEKLADAAQLNNPPRMSKSQIQHHISPMQWSFLSESRQISNQKIKQHLGIQLQYPSVIAFLARHRLQIQQLAQSLLGDLKHEI